MTYQDKTRFAHETVVLDGVTYSNCEFATCRLVYTGGELPVFEDCRFSDCDWKFDEAAARSLSYLRLMWNVGAKAPVQAAIKDVTAAPK